jgi:hypothetical protein
MMTGLTLDLLDMVSILADQARSGDAHTDDFDCAENTMKLLHNIADTKVTHSVDGKRAVSSVRPKNEEFYSLAKAHRNDPQAAFEQLVTQWERVDELASHLCAASPKSDSGHTQWLIKDTMEGLQSYAARTSAEVESCRSKARSSRRGLITKVAGGLKGLTRRKDPSEADRSGTSGGSKGKGRAAIP